MTRDIEDLPRFDEDDSTRVAHLATLLPPPRLERIIRKFAVSIAGSDGERLIQLDPGAKARWDALMRNLIEEMLRGPHDDAYWMGRQDAARAWVGLDLPPALLFRAAGQLREDLRDLAELALPARLSAETARSVDRLLDRELAVFSDTYTRTHEARQLRSLQDIIVGNMPVTVLCLDGEGAVKAATRRSTRLFGEQPAEGHRYDAYLPRAFVEAADLPSHVGQALATGQEVTIPRVVVGEPPRTRHFRVHVVPLEHELARVLLHVEELTDVVQAEARARQAEALAQVGALAANVAHEIRNPLSAISLTLQVIDKSLGPADRRHDVLIKVNEQVRRLDQLVTDLLDYARPPQPATTRHALPPLVEETVAAHDPDAEVVVLADVHVRTDGVLLQQALLNLLQNARHAAGPGGRVLVRVGPGPEILVNDDGPGIDPGIRPQLFSPFVTSKARGTGLGLAISRKLLEAMDGRLDLVDGPVPAPAGTPAAGGGASFRITLPEAPPPEASPAGIATRTD